MQKMWARIDQKRLKAINAITALIKTYFKERGGLVLRKGFFKVLCQKTLQKGLVTRFPTPVVGNAHPQLRAYPNLFGLLYLSFKK